MKVKGSDFKIGVYARESRDDYGEDYETIETQRDLTIRFVNKNNLGKITNIYMDDNVSGSGFERPGIELLKQDIMAKKIDMLIMKDLSRLGRNNAKTLLFLDFLEEHGIRVITLDGKYDSVKDNDTVGIETWFNERYIRDISKKIRMNIRHKIEMGEYIGSAPFGYKKSLTAKNTLIVDDSKAQIVRQIYDKYLEGDGYRSIAKWLNEMHYLPPSGKLNTIWSAVAVRRILTNRVYVGDTVQGVSEKVSFKSKKTKLLPKDKWIITKSTHQAIVPDQVYNKVQKIRKSRGRDGGHKGKIHPFRGILFCGRCGSSLVARKRKERPMAYICSNYMKNGVKACSSHHIAENILIKVVGDELLDIFCRTSIIQDIENKWENGQLYATDSSDRIRKLNKELDDKNRQLEVLYIDRLEGKISIDLFSRMQIRLESDISEITKGINYILRNNKQPDLKSIVEEITSDISAGIIGNDVISALVNRITVFNHNDDISESALVKYLKNNENKEGTVLVEFNF